MVVRTSASLALALLLFTGCDSEPDTDAGTDAGLDAGATETDAGLDGGSVSCDDLMPVATDLVMSEIRPGEYIELFNPSDVDVDLATSGHWFCSPFIYVPLDMSGGVVPAHGYLSIDWPFAVVVSAAMEGSGELILYSAGTDFDDGALIADFVCWGTQPAQTRKVIAEVSGDWSGECAAAVPSGGSVHRVMGSDGQGAASYDTSAAPSRLSCAP